jgi:hypothetical protein
LKKCRHGNKTSRVGGLANKVGWLEIARFCAGLTGLQGIKYCLNTIMAAPHIAHRLTEAEYLALERAAAFKSEFYDGEMFATAGGKPMHSLIAANLIGELRAKLKGSPCKVFTSDLRLKVDATGLFTYPDVSVVALPSLKIVLQLNEVFAGVEFTPSTSRPQSKPA